jgi:pimeloyl-ACP methyl ester carboxylesterase
MASKKRTVGLIGGIIGVAAAGVAAGVATERYLTHRSRRSDDPLADEPFGELPFDEELTVTGPDDVALHVEIVESDTPAATLVFVHGFCLDMGTFHFQREEFAGRFRAVFYDQPGHGRSGRLAKGEYTVDALGESLEAVIDACAPAGPIVLIGHSMGGMTIMALAEQQPALFERVAGVVLISTSAGKLAAGAFGLPDVLARFHRPLMPIIRAAGPVTSNVVDRARGAATDLAWLLTRRYGFGTARPSPALVSYVERMNSTTSTEVIARYLRTLYAHSRELGVGALRAVPVQIICGDVDAVTPLVHSQEIAAVLPDAEFVVVPGGGHVALLEKADEVDEALDRFLRKVIT